MTLSADRYWEFTMWQPHTCVISFNPLGHVGVDLENEVQSGETICSRSHHLQIYNGDCLCHLISALVSSITVLHCPEMAV